MQPWMNIYSIHNLCFHAYTNSMILATWNSEYNCNCHTQYIHIVETDGLKMNYNLFIMFRMQHSRELHWGMDQEYNVP